MTVAVRDLFNPQRILCQIRILRRLYQRREQIGYNQVLSTGNMLENQFEVYDNPIIVEYFPGLSRLTGMDWQSLRLVFEEYENEWRLTGIIHNQWTI